MRGINLWSWKKEKRKWHKYHLAGFRRILMDRSIILNIINLAIPAYFNHQPNLKHLCRVLWTLRYLSEQKIQYILHLREMKQESIQVHSTLKF